MGQFDSKLGKRRRNRQFQLQTSQSPPSTRPTRQQAVFTGQVTLVATVFVLLGTLLLQRMGVNVMATDRPRSAQTPVQGPTQPSSNSQTTSDSLPASGEPAPPDRALAPSLPITAQPQDLETSGLVYNATQSANLSESDRLQDVVDDVVDWVDRRGLPPKSLSVSLIDLNTNSYAAYQDEEQRFPASISKLFWMVELYAWIENGILPAEYGQFDISTCKTNICQMIQDSDNEAASRIVDLLTNTQSGQELTGGAFTQWLYQRKELNRFFQAAGYDGIDISQKNFPIPYLDLDRPKGADLLMRGDPSNPIRNMVTSSHAARLMYEIVTDQAVSPSASDQMLALLTRYDLATGAWREKEYDPIQGFLGEALPPNVELASKVGWTSESRHEVAYIKTPDGSAEYILVVFAEDAAYGADWQIFPEISSLVFDRMTQ